MCILTWLKQNIRNSSAPKSKASWEETQHNIISTWDRKRKCAQISRDNFVQRHQNILQIWVIRTCEDHLWVEKPKASQMYFILASKVHWQTVRQLFTFYHIYPKWNLTLTKEFTFVIWGKKKINLSPEQRWGELPKELEWSKRMLLAPAISLPTDTSANQVFYASEQHFD